MDNFIIYNTDDGQSKVSLLAKDGTVWCTQAQMAELFNVQKAAISKHLKNLFEDGEVDKNSVVSILETTAADGKKSKVAFYSLDMILAVGLRVRSPRGAQFRRWANSATVPSILQRSAKWQSLYFDRGIKAFLGCSDWMKVFYRKEGLS